jgi:pescadillo protein
MGKIIKKNKVGEATKFISRAKALKKLQLSLKDFRKLCILKGIYPREPPKKLLKKQKTFYHVKDINFLATDKILTKYREIKAHTKKIRKFKFRGDQIKVKKLIESRPKMTLTHLVKER